MKVYEEIDLCDFSPWAGAKAFVDRLTDEQKMVIQQAIEELYPQGLSQGDLKTYYGSIRTGVVSVLASRITRTFLRRYRRMVGCVVSC